jgi:biopolymer transport protein ExbD
MQSANPLFSGLGGDSIMGRKRDQETPEFDITAMVDLVFMMNIYFLVTFITVALAEINLPTASHCEPLDADTAVILTLLGTPDGKGVTLKIGDGDAPQVADVEEQNDRVASAIEEGVAAGKTDVLIKAEKKVRLGELFRIATAASGGGAKMHVAVTETDADK